MRREVQELWNLVEPHVDAAGLDLVELEWGRESSGWVLRLYIDRPFVAAPRLPGAEVDSALCPPVSLGYADCERVSRDVGAALDVADLIPHAYRLEVSSPGIDRPLRRERDFRRFAGSRARVRTTDPVAGRRNFSGTIRAVHDGVVDLACDDRSCALPLAIIARAVLVPDWDAEFHRPSRNAS